MKLHDRFVGNLLDAIRSSQGQDPTAATAIIQDALRGAGLMPAAPPPASAPASAAAGRFVDLNEAPAWTGKPAAPAAAPAPGPLPNPAAALRDALAGLAGRFDLPMPGQARGRAPAADPAAPGQFLHGEAGNAAGTRAYRLYVPARPADGPRPLLVMLHGCKQDAADFAAGTAMNALAEEHGCLVLYPEQTPRANGSNCWNWFEAQHQGRDGGEPSIIADMTRAVVREHGADPARVYVAGLSAGGAMAAILGAACPDLYAAVGVHSGLAAGCAHDLMSGLNAMKGARAGKAGPGREAPAGRRVPAIVFHGDRDAVVHPSNGDAVLAQFAAGARLREVEERGSSGAGRSHTRRVALDDAGTPVLESWLLHGAGHAWAGGSPAGSYTDAAGPDASAEMLRFFLGQRRD
ncbi:PHB depolymerase family esterase [uncultured Massilia sp.]|uniref:extracellular catalytic domain type 1 short-chain-length polyhydroxyalkanoate depolymerase n=1 Tax=uncultured Massilia sp. TaxID=169973 RepID=UPI0025E0629B|nr:PHB depolymerase family esterase [uncultured Massilia sp.]